MKEKRNIYCLKALTVAAVICFAGCSDDFLKDKKVYGSYDSSVVYENYDTATSRVDYLYLRHWLYQSKHWNLLLR